MQQNKAARIAPCLPPRSNRNKMYDKLKWLPVLQLVVYHTLLCVHRIRKERETEYLAIIFCYDNIRGNSRILVDRISIELQRNIFTHRGAIDWNKLPPDLRLEPKISKFKTGLKVWVTENVERFLPWSLWGFCPLSNNPNITYIYTQSLWKEVVMLYLQALCLINQSIMIGRTKTIHSKYERERIETLLWRICGSNLL